MKHGFSVARELGDARRSGQARVFASIVEAVRGAPNDPSTAQAAIGATARAVGGDCGSVFLLWAGERWLRGAFGVWDWTRASFRAHLDDWPSVRSAIEANQPTHLVRQHASGAEADWFEQSGISSCVIAPLVGESRSVGVLFVDYLSLDRSPSMRDLEFAHGIATWWARAIEDVVASSGVRRRLEP